MMHCPVCASRQTTVYDSRPVDSSVRRRRDCVKCEHRWTTYEVSVEAYNALADIEDVLDQAAAAIDGLRKESRSIKSDAGILPHHIRRVGPLNAPEDMKQLRAAKAARAQSC